MRKSFFPPLHPKTWLVVLLNADKSIQQQFSRLTNLGQTIFYHKTRSSILSQFLLSNRYLSHLHLNPFLLLASPWKLYIREEQWCEDSNQVTLSFSILANLIHILLLSFLKEISSSLIMFLFFVNPFLLNWVNQNGTKCSNTDLSNTMYKRTTRLLWLMFHFNTSQNYAGFSNCATM